jgi:hypothetical protein
MGKLSKRRHRLDATTPTPLVDEELEDDYEDEEEEDEEEEEEEEEEEGDEGILLEFDGQQFLVDPDLAEGILEIQGRTDEISEEYNRLYAEKTRLDGELAAASIRIDEYEQSYNLDDDELNQAIAEEIEDRLQAWSDVLPALRADNATFEPDFKLSGVEVRSLYLQKVYPDLKLDSYEAESDEAYETYVEGLWQGLKPKPSTTTPQAKERAINRTDALFATINNARHNNDNTDPTSGLSEIEKVRAERAAQIEQNHKNGRGA